MRKYLLLTFTIFAATSYSTSKQLENRVKIIVFNDTSDIKEDNPLKFIPKDYVLFEKIKGDLNKDGIDDYVLVIKGTQKSEIEKNNNGQLVDRNRRGIIILINTNSTYKPVINNYSCFSSENEDGGVYFVPELSVSIKRNNLHISYGHGRYGQWSYTFRLQNSDFELIGYDSKSGGPVIENETSINFLTKKLQEKVNTNENAQGGDEVYKETWRNIKVLKTTKLSQVIDFDDIDLSYVE